MTTESALELINEPPYKYHLPMTTKRKKKVYERVYDGEAEGFSDSTRPNRLLGTFSVEQQIYEDFYSEEFVGTRHEDGKTYLVRGDEVSGMYNPKNGGTRYSITPLTPPRKKR